MFGSLMPDRTRTSDAELARYRNLYCSTCGSLSRRYGRSSRVLLVHDVVSLAWLLEEPDAGRQYGPRNCLNPFAHRKRHPQSAPAPLEDYLAAVSAYAASVKINDDVIDDGTWQARVASRLFRRATRQARDDLAGPAWDGATLDVTIQRQAAVEADGCLDLEVVAQPTADAYGAVAGRVASLVDAKLPAGLARKLGRILGAAVYVVDAIRDFRRDSKHHAFNPLCGRCAGDAPGAEAAVKREAAEYLVRQLFEGHRMAEEFGGPLASRWGSLESRMLQAAGISEKSVTLYSTYCCVPCGDGAVACDAKDCNECAISACVGCCLLVCICNHCH